MNLIDDPWLPVVRRSGIRERIAPWQVVDPDDPVVDFDAPRPDFQGALYQFLIGLIQSAYAPEDLDDWSECWEISPTVDELKKAFTRIRGAFEFDDRLGPAFMQDLSLEDGEAKPITALLIDFPGGKTLKDNLDFFVKRDVARNICTSCAAQALFTLQINAPSGGVGHRVSLRGGGPLTTLVLPANNEQTLWHRLWMNVLAAEDLAKPLAAPDSSCFPWMAPTRVSDKKGCDTYPDDVHPLQAYWSMPRRIRLEFSGETGGSCTLCGEDQQPLVHSFKTRNYGVNYSGPWMHPLTPYRLDPKKEKPPLSVKGRQGGLSYRDWLGLTLGNDTVGEVQAQVVRDYLEYKAYKVGDTDSFRLWCFGYDMDNMKARCWYDQTLPVFHLDPQQRANIHHWVKELLGAASDVVQNLRAQVKEGWFRRPREAKGNLNMIDQSFWHRTEPTFYRLLASLANLPGDTQLAPPEIYGQWCTELKRQALSLFDEWVLSGAAEDQDLKRIVSARTELQRKLRISKSLRHLADRAQDEKETA